MYPDSFYSLSHNDIILFGLITYIQISKDQYALDLTQVRTNLFVGIFLKTSYYSSFSLFNVGHLVVIPNNPPFKPEDHVLCVCGLPSSY